MRISIIGGGYVGLVTGSCLSTLGHNVTIIDIESSKINAINKKIPPIYEEGLDKILNGYCPIRTSPILTFSPNMEAVL